MAKKIQLHGSFTSSDSTGMTWRGTWCSDLSYSYGDVVQYNGSAYIVGVIGASIPSGVSPDDDPDNWHLFVASSDGIVINF